MRTEHNEPDHPSESTNAADGTTQQPNSTEAEERKFHGWRLLGVIFAIVVVLAVISATVDWIIIGPLEGRAW